MRIHDLKILELSKLDNKAQLDVIMQVRLRRRRVRERAASVRKQKPLANANKLIASMSSEQLALVMQKLKEM